MSIPLDLLLILKDSQYVHYTLSHCVYESHVYVSHVFVSHVYVSHVYVSHVYVSHVYVLRSEYPYDDTHTYLQWSLCGSE